MKFKIRNYAAFLRLPTVICSLVASLLFSCNLPELARLNNSNDPQSSTYTGGTPHYVTYNANGAYMGAAPNDPVGHVSAAAVVVAGNTGSMLNSSLVFAGWNTAANGSGTCYGPGATIIMGTSNITLYALWYMGATNYTISSTASGPNNGYIFYDSIATTGTLFRENGALCRYLEAAPTDQATSTPWSSSGIVSVPTGTALGTGYANTLAIIATVGAGSNAAQICRNYTLSVLNDWFLPSRDEAQLLYNNLVSHGWGNFPVGAFYWASTQESVTNAYAMYTSASTPGNNNMLTLFNVRAIRAF